MTEEFELLDDAIAAGQWNETREEKGPMWGFVPWTNPLEWLFRFGAVLAVLFVVAILCASFFNLK
jgi:hypothetical protein